MRTVRLADETFQVCDGFDRFWDKADAGKWEPKTLRTIKRHVGRSTVVFDIGAWIGPTVLYAARNARRVIAFEPDPIALAALETNLSLNPDVADKVTVLDKAVWTEAGVRMMGNKREQGNSESSLLTPKAGGGWPVECVDPSTLLSMVSASEPVFVKMDVEGAEYHVLPALAPLFQRTQIACLVAFHPWTVPGRSRASVAAAMRKATKPFKQDAVSIVDGGTVGSVLLAQLSLVTGRWPYPPRGNVLFRKRH